MKNDLIKLITNKQAHIGVIGLGYVGLPLLGDPERAAESRRDGGDAGSAWTKRDDHHGACDHDIDVWL